MSLSVPYLRILKITKHIADAILKQSKDLNFFLSRDTQNDVLIVIAKDNIDLNPTSNAATMDYHGAGLSLIQMHSKKSEITVYDYINAMDNFIHSLKIDSLPEEHSQISTFVSDLAGFSKLRFSILNQAVRQGNEWLDTMVGYRIISLRNNTRIVERALLLCLLFYMKKYICINIVTN